MDQAKSVRLSDGKVCALEICIICYKDDGNKVTGGPVGRDKVWAAALAKRDAVYARLLSLPNRGKYFLSSINYC